MNIRRNAGWTLLELIITIALFTLMGILLYGLVVYAINSHLEGKMRIEVQQNARETLRRIKEDISRAKLLPTLDLTSGSRIPSAVLHPDSYSTQAATDRLIFSLPATQIESMDYTQPNNYRYAMYLCSTGEKFRLRRCLLNVTTGLGYQGVSLTGGKWLVNLSYFNNSGNYNRNDIIVDLPYASDTVTFTVSHAARSDTYYKTSYDRNLFKVTVRVRQYRRGDINAKAAEWEVATDVRIREGL